MGRTFISQDTQIRKSYVYTDNVAPSATNYETNPVSLEDDLNSLRSQVHNLLTLQTSHWYNDISTPSTFEGGAKRAVDGLNQDLHDLEHKRVLVDVYNLVDVTVPSQVRATDALASSGPTNFADGETVTIDSVVYTFTSPFVDAAFNVAVGGTAQDSYDNLKAAINLEAGAGTLYGTATTLHPTVTALSSSSTTLSCRAKSYGTVGNTIAASSTSANNTWNSAYFTGGAGDMVILSAPQLPTYTTAAIGSVTTLGTVCAYNSGFGIADATKVVTGTDAISPKNLGSLTDATTHDPILSSGRVVYCLFQSESNTDGSTMTGTTPNRAMLSFVRINTASTALELVPTADIAGKTIHYASRVRKYLLGLSEQDFLKGAEIDIPAGATITRQVAYDNQSTVPVDLTTNATLDLQGAGLVWSVRDNLEANLFRIVEGSGTSNTTIHIDSDVDVFDSHAVTNTFYHGATIDSSGTRPIQVGVTDGQIQTSAGDLKLIGAALLAVSDQYQAGSTYSTDLVLADSSAEWSQFETDFGEVSILNALHKAYTHGSRKSKVYANVTTNVNAGVDVGGVGGGANLDTQLPDMSTGTFLTDYDIFVNGELMRPAASVGVNDYYPGTSLANGQLKFDFKLHTNDVLCVIPYNA